MLVGSCRRTSSSSGDAPCGDLGTGTEAEERTLREEAAKVGRRAVVRLPGYRQGLPLRAAYSGWKPRQPQRHLVVNTLVTDWNDHEANAISDVIFILQGESGWAIQLVGRYHDTLHHDDGTWRFHHRAAEFLTEH